MTLSIYNDLTNQQYHHCYNQPLQTQWLQPVLLILIFFNPSQQSKNSMLHVLWNRRVQSQKKIIIIKRHAPAVYAQNMKHNKISFNLEAVKPHINVNKLLKITTNHHLPRTFDNRKASFQDLNLSNLLSKQKFHHELIQHRMAYSVGIPFIDSLSFFSQF